MFQNPENNDRNNHNSQQRYEKIKNRIISISDLIKNMKDYFYNLHIDNYELNANLNLFIFYLTGNFNLKIKDKQFIIHMLEKEYLKKEENIKDTELYSGFNNKNIKDNNYIISNKFGDAK